MADDATVADDNDTPSALKAFVLAAHAERLFVRTLAEFINSRLPERATRSNPEWTDPRKFYPPALAEAEDLALIAAFQRIEHSCRMEPPFSILEDG